MTDVTVAIDTPFGRLYITGDGDAVDSVAFTAPCTSAQSAQYSFVQSAQDGDMPVAVAETVRRLGEYFAGERRTFELPLRRTGLSAFARDVLDATSRIPYAHSAGYGEIAAAIGRPGAARAVGRVLSRNPHAVVVPCHRVRGSGGDLVGYAGGIGAKRFLCELEAEVEDDARLRPGAAELRYLRSRDAAFAESVAGMEPIPPAVASAMPDRAAAQSEQLTLLEYSDFDYDMLPDALNIADATAAALRRAGITGRRAAIVENAARSLCTTDAFAAVRSLGDDEAAAALGRCDGVGKWTARMLLMFALGRADVMPFTDRALRRAARRIINAENGSVSLDGGEKPVTPSELARRSQRWSPCRSAACLYLWAIAATDAYQLRLK